MGKDTAANGRLQRGIALADAGAAVQHGDLWVVQGTERNWTVNLDSRYGPTCNCPDYQNRLRDSETGGQCKHIIAAQITDSREACRRKKTAKPKVIRHDGQGLQGIVADMDRLDEVAGRLGV